MKFTELIKVNQLTLVDFHATWCGPCKMMAPILDEFKKRVGEKVKIIKIDVDKNQQLATDVQVKGVPTLILYKDGKQVWRQSGLVQANDLEKLVANY